MQIKYLFKKVFWIYNIFEANISFFITLTVDEEKSKKLKTKEADPNYQNVCEKQLLKPRSISLHFLKKGAKLRGLDSVTCQFNGEFAPKQCIPGIKVSNFYKF